MNPALINRLTWQDIDEIVSFLDGKESENLSVTQEEYYSEVLKKLHQKHKTTMYCVERYKTLLPIAEEIVGFKNTRRRTFDQLVLRCIVACKLREEGFSVSAIGRAMGYSHANILYYFGKKQDFFAIPTMYERELRWFREFNEEIEERSQSPSD